MRVLVVIALLSTVEARPREDGSVGVCGVNHYNVCFTDPEPLGCFENGPDTPWCHLIDLPQDPKDFQPQFWLYTPERGFGRPQTVDFFHLTNSLSALELDQSHPFWTVVHGFGQDWPKSWIFPMVEALLSENNNVLLVRWSKGAAAPDYFQAASNTRVMGAVVARILSRMVDLNGLSLHNANIVGFSLGAHVAGFAGARLPGLRRIVGLDPAGPLYASEDPLYTTPETRLNHTDAEFVQCIHTDGLSIWKGGAGTTNRFGDVDFLANGGEIQPGCQLPLVQAGHDILHMNWSMIMGDLKCSHVRAPFLFIASILNSVHSDQCKFKAYPCSSPADWLAGNCFSCDPVHGCPVAGYQLDLGTPFNGLFAFSTRADNSSTGLFCGTQYVLSLQPDQDVKGSLDIQFMDASNDLSDSVPYQSIDETLSQTQPNKRVVVGNFGQKPSKIRISYKRYTSTFWWRDGPTKFSMLNINLLSQDGNVLKYVGNALIVDSQTTTITLT